MPFSCTYGRRVEIHESGRGRERDCNDIEGGEYDMIEGWKGEGADKGRSIRLCVGNDISIQRERERDRDRDREMKRERERERERWLCLQTS